MGVLVRQDLHRRYGSYKTLKLPAFKDHVLDPIVPGSVVSNAELSGVSALSLRQRSLQLIWICETTKNPNCYLLLPRTWPTRYSIHILDRN